MHEMAIAMELLRQLERIAAGNGLSVVEAVSVRAGALRGIVPEALNAAFGFAAEGTCAEGAAINVEIVASVAECRQCGSRFAPEVDSFLCSHCGRADVEIVAGNDIILVSVTGR